MQEIKDLNSKEITPLPKNKNAMSIVRHFSVKGTGDEMNATIVSRIVTGDNSPRSLCET